MNNNPNRGGSRKEKQMNAITRATSVAVLVTLSLALAAWVGTTAAPCGAAEGRTSVPPPAARAAKPAPPSDDADVAKLRAMAQTDSAKGAEAEPASRATRDDWEFQFRTMGYGTIDLRSEAQKHYEDAQRRRKDDRRGDSRMRGLTAMIEYWRARNPTAEERKRLDDTERRLRALRAAMEGVPDGGPEADQKWPQFDVESRNLRGIVDLRPEPIGPRPQLLRNDEAAPGLSLDDPPLLDPQAKFWPEDRDQVDVVLRRTRALIGYRVAAEPRQAQWKVFAEDLRRVEAAAQTTRPDLTGKDAARHQVYMDLCALRRRVVLANPLLDFDDLLFIEYHNTGTANYLQPCDYPIPPGGGLYILRGCKTGNPQVVDLLGAVKPENGDYTNRFLSGGIVRRAELSYDGQTVYFSWADPGQKTPYHFHVFRIRIDGTGLRQLTSGPWSDMDPCELPNGRIVFCSTRRVSGDRCCLLGRRSAFLHSMRADGSDIICLSFHETHEWEPGVDNAGQIIYSRWDYVDRPAAGQRNLWICKPDGTDPRSPHGNYGPYSAKGVFDPPIRGYYDSPAYQNERNGSPLSEASIRAIPGSSRYLAIAGQHDFNGVGPIVLIAPNVSDDYLHSQITRVTPEFYEHNNHVKWNMIWATPWPLSVDFYLVNRYESIGILDRFGNFESVYGMHRADACNRERPGLRRLVGCFWGGMQTHTTVLPKASEVDGVAMRSRPLYPVPVRARLRPPVLPDRTFQAAARRGLPDHRPATLTVMNVYDADVPLPAGAKISRMRIIQLIPGVSGYGNMEQPCRMTLGTVPVEPDGSVYCEAPIEKGLMFQLLDQDGLAVHGMKSLTYVHRGEHLTCAGCHESRERAPAARAAPLALRKAAARIEPEFADHEPALFKRHIEPILDGVCVRCHREERKGPRTLSETSLLSAGWIRKGSYPLEPKQPSRTTPGGFGAFASPLWRHTTKNRSSFTSEQLRRLSLWLDLNCPTHAVTGNQAQTSYLEWPRNIDFDPFNPLGIEVLEPAGDTPGLDGERLAKALAPLGHEQRAALLEWAAWRLGKDPFPARGRKQDLHRLLIPMLTSQLPRIHDGAAAWLRRLHAGKAAPKDLAGWCAYYATTFGAKDMNPPALAALVEERVLVVKSGVTNDAGYSVAGQKARDIEALETLLRQEAAAARAKGQRLRVAALPPASVEKTEGAQAFEDAKQAAWRIVGNCTVYPDGYPIRQPWTPRNLPAP